MERRILQPEQIIVPGEYELGNEQILKIYHGIFEKGHGEDLPPVIVCSSGYVPEQERQFRYCSSVRQYVSWLSGNRASLHSQKFGQVSRDISNKEDLDS